MSVAIPNRPVFRSPEVCEIVDVQPYVLRTWEAEFPDLGVAKVPGGPRMYRRADVEKVARIKHLLFVDGLTLSGARRKLGEESPKVAEENGVADADVAALIDLETRRHLKTVRQGLQWILGVLAGSGAQASDFVLTPAPAAAGHVARAPKKMAPVASRPKAAAKPAPKKAGKKK